MGCTTSRPPDGGEEQVSKNPPSAGKAQAGVPEAPSSRYPPAELATPPVSAQKGAQAEPSPFLSQPASPSRDQNLKSADASSAPGFDWNNVVQLPSQADRVAALEAAAAGFAMSRVSPRMLGCPRPANDCSRAAALASTCLCSGLAEDRFDHFTKLVKGILKVPICQITLVSEDMVHGKASQGGLRGMAPMPRDVAFCSWALLPKNPEMLVVEDTKLDGRFRDHPVVVSEPFIRFYAGAPLIASDGHALGTLCGMDFEPRHLDGHLLEILSSLAELVMREIEQDLAANLIPGAVAPQWACPPTAKTLTTPTSTLDPFALASTGSLLNTTTYNRESIQQGRPSMKRSSMRSTEDLKHGFMLCKGSDPAWPVLFATDTWCSLVGIPLDKVVDRSLWDIFEVDPWSKDAALQSLKKKTQKDIEIGAAVKAKGSLKAFNITFKQHNGDLDGSSVPIGIPSFVRASTSEAPDLCFVMISEATQLAGLACSQAVGSPLFHAPSGSLQPGMTEITEDIFTGVALGPLLGKGSFGKVFRGTWQNETVAVKILEKVLQPEDRKGGLDHIQHSLEATLGVGLDHPRLVTTLVCHSRLSRGMVGHVSGIDRPIRDNEPCVLESWILLEYCGKGSLLDALFKGWLRTERSLLDGAPDFHMVLATALDIATALEYLHAANILHGDLTCNNTMLQGCSTDPRGFVAKVGDFGLSRLMDKESDSLETCTHGTVTHMPPELLMDGRLSRATDVYSFGVILWEIYTARRAFAGLMSHQIFLKITTEGLQLPFPAATPPAYSALAERCRANVDTERPSFTEIVEALREMQSGPDLQQSIQPFAVLALSGPPP
ncbi:hypothetical protein WJX74_006733 [Apatococcus lobatus]|uniref:Protein kinase domain-containing protein n=1 Tax=Apatococcus lobatus TaxID=904363 RepID=A0AAW1QXW9_9CHLO